MTKRLYEAGGAKPTPLGDGVFEVCIIKSGWGSSGYYSPDMLKEFGPSVFRAGRPSFANHPTEAEFDNGRDITKIMGRLVTESEVREHDDGSNSLWGKLKVKTDWVDFVEEYKDTIGLSIFASGTVQEGEAEGRTGLLVESLDADDPYTSVDFVVAAGAGGKVERMLESFRAHEALKTDREEQLRNLVRDAYSEDRVYAWVRDFDDDLNLVYFDVDGNDNPGIYCQSYSVSDDIAIELVGEREEVRVETTYVPIIVRQTTESAPADNDKENGMTPEEIKAAVLEAVKEALVPAPPTDEVTAGPTVAEVAEAVATSGLPESARKRVYAAIEAGTEVSIAIEAEKALIEEVKESLKTDDEGDPGHIREAAVEEVKESLKTDDEGDPGYIREAAGSTGTSTRVNISGWSN